MKKIFSVLFMFSLFSVTAQTVSTMSLSAPTLSNASTVTATLQTQLAYENVTLQAMIDKISGTVAGSVTVSGSVDGTNYVNLPDTFEPANVSGKQYHSWEFNNNNYLYWKATFLGAGTMSVTPAALLFTNGGGAKRSAVSMKDVSGAATTVTVTNTGVDYVSAQVSNWYNTVSIQSVVTKISGTVAGTVTLQGSVDGNGYVTVDSNFANFTSFSPTNQTTNTRIFVVTGSPYKYYRLSYTGAGTMAATLKGYVLPNKK